VRRVIALASFIPALLSQPASAERVVREISWSALKAAGRLPNGEVVPPAANARLESLRVTNTDGAPRAIPILAIDAPGVKAPRYLFRGEVRGEGIEGQGYLEMWSFFAGGGRYFSRTLAQAGPMGSLSGTFASRPFILPFTAEPGMVLEKLAVNVALPGRGTVVLGPLRLVELDPGDDFALAPGAWLTPRQLARAGAIGGSLLGPRRDPRIGPARRPARQGPAAVRGERASPNEGAGRRLSGAPPVSFLHGRRPFRHFSVENRI